MTPLFSLKLTVSAEESERIELALEQAEPVPVSVARFEEHDGGPWTLDALFLAEPDRSLLADLIRETVGRSADFDLAPVPERDWVGEALKGLAPVPAGRIWLHGAHDRASVPPGAVGIEIEAGAAFGTGHHATTLGCLLALQDVLRAQRPRRILDVGTGTGVLAIAAAKLTRARIFASDIDPLAVRVARENARKNGVGPRMRLARAAGLHHPSIRAGAPYDLIFGNILAGPLARLAGPIAAVTVHRTMIVLSGLLDSQSAGVQATYRLHGFVVAGRLSIDGWTTLILEKQ